LKEVEIIYHSFDVHTKVPKILKHVSTKEIILNR
jgi:hypothetical protein